MVLRILLFGAVIALAACSGEAGPEGPAGPPGPAGPQGPAGEAATVDVLADLTCTECHNDTTILVSKVAQMEESHHGSGDSWVRGANANCAGCHGSEAASMRIDAGLPPHDASVEGVVNVSPFNCRTCHDVHMTFTSADWSLTGDAAPAPLEYPEATFDGGDGNLCANCHQNRNQLPALTGVEGAEYEVTTSRFGPHHGIESQMLLGLAGQLGVEGSASPHLGVPETCVGCHMGEEYNHTWEPEVSRCQACHSDAESFDIDGTQTEIEALLEEVRGLLIDAGIINLELDPEGNRSVTAVFPEEVVGAMWNYMMVVEDHSMGVHNPNFARALLESAKAALGG